MWICICNTVCTQYSKIQLFFSSYDIFETNWRLYIHTFRLLDSFTSLHSFLDENEMYMETLHIYRMS